MEPACDHPARDRETKSLAGLLPGSFQGVSAAASALGSTNHGKTGCWTEALRSTERAIKRGTVESDKRGAYFCAAVVRQLERKGVSVPSGTPEERQDIHTLITASLGVVLASEDCP